MKYLVVDYPLLEDYDDPLLYEFHVAGILTESERLAMAFTLAYNKSITAIVYNRKFKLFPPFQHGALTPVSGG